MESAGMATADEQAELMIRHTTGGSSNRPKDVVCLCTHLGCALMLAPGGALRTEAEAARPESPSCGGVVSYAHNSTAGADASKWIAAVLPTPGAVGGGCVGAVG